MPEPGPPRPGKRTCLRERCAVQPWKDMWCLGHPVKPAAWEARSSVTDLLEKTALGGVSSPWKAQRRLDPSGNQGLSRMTVGQSGLLMVATYDVVERFLATPKTELPQNPACLCRAQSHRIESSALETPAFLRPLQDCPPQSWCGESTATRTSTNRCRDKDRVASVTQNAMYSVAFRQHQN